jgi:hypothetical protein
MATSKVTTSKVTTNGVHKSAVTSAAPAASTTNGAVAVIVHANAPAVTGPALPSVGSSNVTGTTSAPAIGVLASLGVKNTGFTQVKVETVATTEFKNKVSERLNGVQTDLPADSNINVNGQTFAVSTVVSILQAILALFTAKATAQKQAKALVATAVAAMNTELPLANQFITGLDTALLGMFAKGNPVLENFGLSKGIAKTPTLLVKAEGVGTAKLTRTERKTMGKVQKAKVKGGSATLALTSPSGAVIAGSLPAAPAPTTTPAPAAGSNGSTGNTSGQ